MAVRVEDIAAALRRQLEEIEIKVEAADIGSVVEVGSHDQLTAREGHYYRLYQAQARNVDTEQELCRIELERADGERQ